MSDTGAKVCGTVESEAWWGSFTTTLINTSDDSRALHMGDIGAAAEISDFTFGIPGGATINGIEVVAEFSCSNATQTAFIDLSLSYDDGANYTPAKEESVTGVTDKSKTYGGPTDTWGRAWTAAEFADGTFRIKVLGFTSHGTYYCRLDYLYAIVYYTLIGNVIIWS